MANDSDNVLSVLVRFRTNIDKMVAEIKRGTGQVAESGKQLSGVGEAGAAAFGRIGGVIKGLAGPLAALMGLRELVSLFKQGVAEAAAAEAAEIKLTASVQRYGVSMADVLPLIEEVRKELLAMGFQTEKTDAAIQTFQTRGATFTQSLNATRVAAKLAAAEGGTLEEAVQGMGMAMQGQVRTGSELGKQLGNLRFELEKIEDPSRRLQFVMDAVAGKVDKAAQMMGDATETKFRRFGAAWSEMIQKMGESVIGRAGVAVVDWLRIILERMNAIEDAGKRFQQGGAITDKQKELDAAKHKLDALQEGTKLFTKSDVDRSYAGKWGSEGGDMASLAYKFDTYGAAMKPEDRTKAIAAAKADVARLQKELSDVTTQERNKALDAAKQADANKLAENAALQSKQLREFLDKSGEMELEAKADLYRKLADSDAKLRQAQFDQQMATTVMTLEERANAIKAHYLFEEAAARKAETTISAIRQAAADADAKRIASLLNERNKVESLTGPGAMDPGRILEVAQAAADSGVGVTEFVKSLKLGPNESKQFASELERLAGSLRKVKDESNAAGIATIQRQNQERTSVSQAFDKQLKDVSAESQRIGTETRDKIQTIEAQKNLGNLTGRDATRQTMQAQTEATELYRQKLAEALVLRQRVKDSPDLAEPDKIEKLKQLTEEIARYNQGLRENELSLEQQASASDDIFLGMKLGLRAVQNESLTMAQGVGRAVSQLTENLSAGVGNALEGLIRGTKTLKQSMTEMVEGMIIGIVRLIAQMAIYKLVSLALGKILKVDAIETGATLAAANSPAGMAMSIAQLGPIAGPIAFTAAMASSVAIGAVASAAGAGAGGAFGMAKHGGCMRAGGGFVPSFAEGGIFPGPVTADDRFPVMVRGGEGFLRPEAVSWLGGAGTIHAMNRLAVPDPIVRMLRSLTVSAPTVPRFSFAEGGVAPLVNLPKADNGGTTPVVVQNVVAIGDSELGRIAASSQMRTAVMATVAANAREIRRTLGIAKG